MKTVDRLLQRAACAGALLLCACADVSGPSSVIRLRTEVAPATVSIGDTLVLRAILTNPTLRQITPSVDCGPPVRFELRSGAAAPIYPIPLDAAFICPVTDLTYLDPGETDTLVVRWPVSAAVGMYTARTGFVTDAGLQRFTDAVPFTVR